MIAQPFRRISFPEPAAIMNGAVVAFAGWTALCHLAVFCGLSLRALANLAFGAVVLVAVVSGWWWVRRRRTTPKFSEPSSSGGASGSGFVWILGVVGVLITLFSHRPDLDDALYIGLAKWHALLPDLPLLRYELLHGVEHALIQSPVYKAHSIELLFAAVEYVTGIPAIVVAHLLVAPFAGLLVVAAQTSLVRKLAPTHWRAISVVLMIVLLLGEPLRFPATLSFVRLFQGKAILLSAVLPWLVFCGFRFMEKPGWKNWWALLSTQIAAVGLSSSALMLAPMTAAIALLSAAVWRRQMPLYRSPVVVGLLTSMYPLLIAGLVWSNIETRIAFAEQVRAGFQSEARNQAEARKRADTATPPERTQEDPASIIAELNFEVALSDIDPPVEVVSPSPARSPRTRSDRPSSALGPQRPSTWANPQQTIEFVFGSSGLLYWFLACLGLALLFSPPRLRRFLVVSLLAFVVTQTPPVNGFLSRFASLAHWRFSWLVPIPLIFASGLVLFGNFVATRRVFSSARPSVRCGASFLPAILFFSLVPSAFIYWAERSPAELRWPSLKVPTEWHLVRELVTEVSRRQGRPPLGERQQTPRLLLPSDVSGWVPTVPRVAIAPLVVRQPYLRSLEVFLPAGEAERRIQLGAIVDNRGGTRRWPAERVRSQIEEAIRDYDLAAVGWKKDSRTERSLGLPDLGFEPWHEGPTYEIWIRKHR